VQIKKKINRIPHRRAKPFLKSKREKKIKNGGKNRVKINEKNEKGFFNFLSLSTRRQGILNRLLLKLSIDLWSSVETLFCSVWY